MFDQGSLTTSLKLVNFIPENIKLESIFTIPYFIKYYRI